MEVAKGLSPSVFKLILVSIYTDASFVTEGVRMCLWCVWKATSSSSNLPLQVADYIMWFLSWLKK